MSSSTCLGGVGLWTFFLSPDMSLDSVVCLKSSCQGDKSIEFRTEDNISSNTPAICQKLSDNNAKA